MVMMHKSLRFDSFSLDLERLRLDGPAGHANLRRKSFDVLRYLIERAGHVVTKEDLIKGVWPDVMVSDESLTQCISDVRRALGEAGHRIIKTVPRRGYLIDVPISASEVPAVDPSQATKARLTGGGAYSQLDDKIDRDHQTDEQRQSRALASRDQQQRTAAATAERPTSGLALPDRPSIAVLPFADLSAEPGREYLADGIVEDIITALSHFHWLFVIARSSSFTYKGRALNVKQIGRELGVRYVLEGSVRSTADRVRVVVQLIDATTGTHISAERFDSELKDIFDVQEKVAARVAGAIAPKLEQNEMARARRKPTENLDAYDHFMRASACVYRWTKEDNEAALRLLYRAIDLDPDFACAYGLAAQCYSFRKSYGPWVPNSQKAVAETARLARRAVELGKDEAFALSSAGYSLAYVAGELDDGVAFIDRALALNPNLARAWNYSGWVRIWLGEPEIAVENLERAMRLSPLDPAFHAMQAAMASAHFVAGRYDKAASWAEKALREQPNNLDVIGSLALSLALAGKLDAARATMANLIRLSPERRLSNINDRLSPYRRPEDRAKVVKAARLAGLPE
jgi:TolB-like protein/Tfp pilus assembly protein PilF